MTLLNFWAASDERADHFALLRNDIQMHRKYQFSKLLLVLKTLGRLLKTLES